MTRLPPPTRRIAWMGAALALILVTGGIVWRAVRPDDSPASAVERDLTAGDLAAAGRILHRWMADAPRDGRARLLHARFLRRLGRNPEADLELGRALDRGVPEAEIRREYALLIAPTNFPEAETGLRKALADQPGDVEVLRALAEGLARRGSFDEAAEWYGRWRNLAPDDSDALRAHARALVQAGRSEQAMADLRASLAKRPDDVEVRLLLGDCLLSEARVAEAEPELKTCARLAPKRPEPLVGLAACARERGDPDRARSLLDQALAIDPASILALSYRGDLELKRRNLDQARDDFERVLAIDPANLPAHLKLAQVYRRLGEESLADEQSKLYQTLDRERRKAAQTIEP